MDIFEEKIDDQALKSLKELLGLSISSIYSTRIHFDIHNDIISLSNSVIPIYDNKLINIKYEWDDTPKEYLNYYKLHVSVSDTTSLIAQEKVEGINAFDSSSITFRESVIKDINLYTKRETCGDEKVIYDCGISFDFEEGGEILLGLDYKNSGELLFIHDKQISNEYKKSCEVRKKM